MGMIRPGFLSSSERLELEACVRSQREDHGIARRANAILLLDDGENCVRIAKFLYLDDDTIRGWNKAYCEGGWVKAGSNPAVQTTAGRGRVNIHGALNLETFDTPFVEPITVDGVSAAQLLAKIEARNPDKRLIHVIRDNAACHKGPDVRAFLARPNCRIHLVHLPPYCPHLNLIERLWAVMHQHVTHNRHYPTQKQFANAILRFFRETIPNEWETLQSQVSDNFRVVTYEKFGFFSRCGIVSLCYAHSEMTQSPESQSCVI